jgi:putative RNA 2'-phosphotransferase
MPFQRDRIRVSKFLSYILRHDPGKYGLLPDKYGFVGIAEVLDALKQRFRTFRDEELFDVLDNDPKGRFEIAGKKIRATYGHSIEVLPFSGEEEPPEVLFHGTSREGSERILKEGLKPMDRKFVHLSISEEDARTVGSRHDEAPVILRIMAGEASRDGIKFYGEANVFLAESIPAKYVVMSDE